MKILVLAMSIPDLISEHFVPLVNLLNKCGAEVTILNYWCIDYHPLSEIKDLKCNYITLSDYGPESIPRITKDEYENLYGHDINFAKSRIHEVIMNNYPVDKNFLYNNSISFQKLYGFAYRIENILKSIRPDFVIIQQCSEIISKLMFSKAKKLNIPTSIFETSFFPNKILIDPFGMHFFPFYNKIDYKWKSIQNRILSDLNKQRLSEYLSKLIEKKSSKYRQPSASQDLVSFIKSSNKRVLFIPGQVPYDANVINYLSVFERFDNMVNFAYKEISEDWIIVFKPHPKYNGKYQIENMNKMHIANENIHDLIDLCDVVFTFSSNVGLEAMIYKKPVIVCGYPHYSRKGLTIDLINKSEFKKALESALNFKYDEEKRLNYLYHIIFEYLIDEDDLESFLEKLNASKNNFYGWHENFAPFVESIFENDNKKANTWLSIYESYNKLSKENLYHFDIMKILYEENNDNTFYRKKINNELKNEAFVFNGERQMGSEVADIRDDHVLRYNFVSNFLDNNDYFLDIACGCGYGTYLLAYKTNVKALGIDASSYAIKYAKKYYSSGNITYKRASVNYLNNHDDRFDKIVCFETLEHVDNDELFLTTIIKSMKNGGVLFLSTPNKKYYYIENNPFHVQHYSKDEVISLLNAIDKNLYVKVVYQNSNSISYSEKDSKFLIFIVIKQPYDSQKLDAFESNLSEFITSPNIVLKKNGLGQIGRKTKNFISDGLPKLFNLVTLSSEIYRKEINSVYRQLEEKENRIKALLNSTSWKVTAPLRGISYLRAISYLIKKLF